MIKIWKLLLREELIGKLNFKQRNFDIYKNPKSIKRMEPFLRGMTFPNGDLFVIDDAFNTIHSHLEAWLNSNGYGNKISKSNTILVDNIKFGYITWQRKGNSNEFYLSESIDFTEPKYFNKDELMPYIEKYTKKVRQKNPQFKFVLKEIFRA